MDISCECTHLVHEPCHCLGAVIAIVRISTNRERLMCGNCTEAVRKALWGKTVLSINTNIGDFVNA